MVKGRKKPKSRSRPSAILKVACCDAFVTFLWMIISSLFGEVTGHISSYFGFSELITGMTLSLIILSVFMNFSGYIGGAIFNPLLNMALIWSGKGSIIEHSVRIVLQLIGTLLGSYAALSFIPVPYQSKFPFLSGGLKDGVSIHLGVGCEAFLVFLMCYLFLVSVDAKGKFYGFYVPLLATIPFTLIGMNFTGPSLNPFVSLSWNSVFPRHTPEEHWIVYWMGPIAGAILAGISYMLALRFGIFPFSSRKRTSSSSSTSSTKKKPVPTAAATASERKKTMTATMSPASSTVSEKQKKKAASTKVSEAGSKKAN